jgi:1-acyl-sn-glycerol-3-phosphate acyltransferase
MADETGDNFRLPTIDRRVLGGFQWFSPRYIRKHFHAVAIHRDGLRPPEIEARDSVVVYANHASWWDPLLAMFICGRLFEGFDFFAPIDADALKKYRIFSRLGFFPVQQDSLQGAKHFLKVSTALLARPSTSIWITPEGRFADVRDQSANLMPGLAHLAHSIQHRSQHQSPKPDGLRVWFLPIAIEYCFWEERLPEALARFGEAILVEPHAPPSSKEVWQTRLTGALRRSQEQLALDSIARNANKFEVLLSGVAGTWRLYDLWRRGVSRLRGKSLELEHGNKLRGD